MDGDGDDDLAWGSSQFTFGGAAIVSGGAPVYFMTVAVNHTTGTIGTAAKLTNYEARGAEEIEIFDVDGDGDLDAVVVTGDKSVTTDLTLFNLIADSGFAVVLDPLTTLKAASFTLSGFISGGRFGAHGDMNADGVPDLAIGGSFGEFVTFFNDGNGKFIPSGRTFALATAPIPDKSRTHGLAATDINHDGLVEIWMTDLGTAPTSLILWINESR
jgi:hypothetical protein